MATKTKNEKLFDVVVYEIKTRRVASVVGRSMEKSTGHSNADKRRETVSPRLNCDYSVGIVAADKFVEGDVLPAKAIK